MDLYRNKIIVAPMVRVGTLPFRLLCLDYGADLVYTEETIDFKMLRTSKTVNDLLGTIDFVDTSDGSVTFRTCQKEKDRLIFQMGTCNAQRALKVAKLVENHVAGIDINMGCPKEFSLKGGMGAALLMQPEKIKDILSTLTSNLMIPVTCKIRVLPSFEETLSLCKLIESCGVSALAVHGRTKDERPRHTNRNDFIKRISESLSIPVIANGGSKEMESLDDIKNFQRETGSSSVMVARAVMWNCSILRKEGVLPIDTVIRDYLKYCILYENAFTYTKYTIQNILRDLQCSTKGKAFLETQTLKEISSIWDLQDFFNEKIRKISSSKIISEFGERSLIPQTIHDISPKIFIDKNGGKNVEMPLQFIRGNFADAELPKMVLNTHVFKNGWNKPKFSSKDLEKLFISEVQVDGVKYSSSIKEKNKRFSEQGAALVCLHALGLVNVTYGFVPMKGTRKYDNLALNNYSKDNINTNSNTSLNTDPNTDSNTCLNTDPNTCLNTDPNTCLNTDPNTCLNTDPNTSANTKLYTALSTNLNTSQNTNFNTNLNTDLITSSNTTLSTIPNTSLNTDLITSSNTTLNTILNTSLNTTSSNGSLKENTTNEPIGKKLRI